MIEAAIVADRIRQVAGWRDILIGGDEEAKRDLIASLEGTDLVVALSCLDELSDEQIEYLARYVEAHSEKVARLREILMGERTQPDAEQRVEDARDQKIDFRVSQGERELWERAAQAHGIPTSEFVRGVVNRAAEQALAAAYATE